MFGLFGKKKSAFDMAEGNPHVAPGLALLKSGDGAALGELYTGLPPADRCHFIDGLGLESEIGAFFPPRPQHPALPAIEGGVRYVWAHRLRGFATSDRTSDEQVLNMFDMAQDAQDALDEAMGLTPGDSALHAFRLRTLTLIGGPEDAFERIGRDIEATGEANVSAEMVRLNYLAPKWHGSLEEMHAFADAAIASPPNAAFLALKARAFIEEWLYENAMSDDEEAAAALKVRAATEGFKQELGVLDDRFHDLLARGPALTRAEAHFAHNNFAFLFTAFIDKARAKRHLGLIASPAATPWGYMTGNVDAFIAKLRKECGLPRA